MRGREKWARRASGESYIRWHNTSQTISRANSRRKRNRAQVKQPTTSKIENQIKYFEARRERRKPFMNCPARSPS